MIKEDALLRPSAQGASQPGTFTFSVSLEEMSIIVIGNAMLACNSMSVGEQRSRYCIGRRGCMKGELFAKAVHRTLWLAEQ